MPGLREYQGVQHRKFTPKFHRTPEDFAAQKVRDALTRGALR